MYSVKKRSRKEKAVSASISHDIGRIAIAHVEKYSGMLGNAWFPLTEALDLIDPKNYQGIKPTMAKRIWGPCGKLFISTRSLSFTSSNQASRIKKATTEKMDGEISSDVSWQYLQKTHMVCKILLVDLINTVYTDERKSKFYGGGGG